MNCDQCNRSMELLAVPAWWCRWCLRAKPCQPRVVQPHDMGAIQGTHGDRCAKAHDHTKACDCALSGNYTTVDPVIAEVARATGADDPINPKHYRGDLVARIIEHFELTFHLGNVIKYVLRHKAKAGIEDLRKARWYLDRAIEILEGKHKEGVR